MAAVVALDALVERIHSAGIKAITGEPRSKDGWAALQLVNPLDAERPYTLAMATDKEAIVLVVPAITQASPTSSIHITLSILNSQVAFGRFAWLPNQGIVRFVADLPVLDKQSEPQRILDGVVRLLPILLYSFYEGVRRLTIAENAHLGEKLLKTVVDTVTAAIKEILPPLPGSEESSNESETEKI